MNYEVSKHYNCDGCYRPVNKQSLTDYEYTDEDGRWRGILLCEACIRPSRFERIMDRLRKLKV